MVPTAGPKPQHHRKALLAAHPCNTMGGRYIYPKYNTSHTAPHKITKRRAKSTTPLTGQLKKNIQTVKPQPTTTQ